MDYTQITDDIATALMSRGFARPIRRDDTTLDCVTPDGSTFRIVVGAQQPKREGKIAPKNETAPLRGSDAVR